MADTDSNYQHGSAHRTGVLLVNLGSPDAPTASALRRYLAEFLWDPRVVEAPRWLWWCALHLVILRIRPSRSAKAYAKVWTDEGSPLIAISKRQHQAIAKTLADNNLDVVVELAMRYGNPSIAAGMQALREKGARRILVLPLYPQYSATTVASVIDEVTDVARRWRWLPELRFINQYHDYPVYINALADSITQHWQQQGRGQKLLFSFHGIPQRYVDNGDPYFCHCQKTARLVAEKLQLTDDEWMVVFQSRFGREPWLQPYCDKTLQALPAEGVKSVDVISPGFSADCLETLEEIDMENREYFLEAGGEQFQYIPALNDRPEHIDALCEIITQHLGGWEDQGDAEQAKQSRERAMAMGANG